MIRINSRAGLVFTSVFIILAVVPPVRGAGTEEREGVARINYLIELLASKNTAPTVRGNARQGEVQLIKFPSDYDRALQVPVYLAVKQLLAEGEAAIDLLLAHKNDNRYSFSLNSYKDENVTVSHACKWIAERKVVCYTPEIDIVTRSQFGLYPPSTRTKDSWEAWWNKNKHRGLATLQIEAIDAQIKFMQQVDGETALPWHADAEKLPIDEFNRRRDANLRTLRAIRQYVVETRTPYRPIALEDHMEYFFGLPWTGRRHNK